MLSIEQWTVCGGSTVCCDQTVHLCRVLHRRATPGSNAVLPSRASTPDNVQTVFNQSVMSVVTADRREARLDGHLQTEERMVHLSFYHCYFGPTVEKDITYWGTMPIKYYYFVYSDFYSTRWTRVYYLQELKPSSCSIKRNKESYEKSNRLIVLTVHDKMI